MEKNTVEFSPRENEHASSYRHSSHMDLGAPSVPLRLTDVLFDLSGFCVYHVIRPTCVKSYMCRHLSLPPAHKWLGVEAAHFIGFVWQI